MTVPLDTQLNIQEKWFGPESSGSYSGNPSVFLYYGSEGLDRDYTVRSLRNELDGYKWTRRMSSFDVDIVYDSVGEERVEPLDDKYSDEILDFLYVQDHQGVRVNTPGTELPSDEIDEVVDHYTVILNPEEYRRRVDNHEDVTQWFAEEARNYERVDFVVGFDGLQKNKEYLQDFLGDYIIPRNQLFVYPEDWDNFDTLVRIVRGIGCRITLPPGYYRERD